MNFLSHFYFDQDTDDCHFILGTVLPDLLKNADKSFVLHPEKLIHADGRVNSIIKGWNKHLLVDKHFHSSAFFAHHSHALKNLLTPAIAGSPVKPFFLGHISIELILDHLILTTDRVSVNDFYEHLNSCNPEVIREFLVCAGMQEPDVFFNFYEEFKRSRYLTTYSNIEQISYALKRICMRVWKDPFTRQQEEAMCRVLADYRKAISNEFMFIYHDIEGKLAGG